MAAKSIPPVDGDRNPTWYKDAVIYQTHVRAFADASGDGIGDFAGLTSKLDYLADLGATALWLMPFYPSPGRDDGYDIANYQAINSAYGTMRDFRKFLREAHAHDIRVITELVINHTSDQHPWFKRARLAPKGSRWRDFYVWSDTTELFEDARVIFGDFETSNWCWDPVAQQYFWHRFYSHQPDLNYDSADVRRSIFRQLDFWFKMGVDGLRLDAIPYLYERDGTDCENLPETHQYLKDLRRHVDENYEDRMLLAEANQWPEDAIAYFGDGDECQMAFHFPLMPRMFMAVHQGNRFPIVDILAETPAIPQNAQWALFLRNHDELTLEMVTDEERDYMYRVYAHDHQARINLGIRRRLAPLLGDDRRKIELMNGLLFSLPGTPIIYYGDEIGMGDNIYLGDRDAVRTPMQWNGDRNAGFSKANPQKLYLPVNTDPAWNYEAVNVETQAENTNSLLWWTKRLIAIRKRHQSLSRGSLEFLSPDNHNVLSFIRTYEDEQILVVANLCEHATYVELDLSDYKGMVPVELFGYATFPVIGDLAYLLTLGPYAFYWMSLENARVGEIGVPTATDIPGASITTGASRAPDVELVPRVAVRGNWDSILRSTDRRRLEGVLPDFIRQRRWFRGKTRTIRTVEVTDSVPVPLSDGEERAYVVIVEIAYNEGEPDNYAIPLMVADGHDARRVMHDHPEAVVARLTKAHDEAVLYNAFAEKSFDSALLDICYKRRKLKGPGGSILGRHSKYLKAVYDSGVDLEPALSKAEQSNTSVVYGDEAILKMYRRLEPGVNPELEIGWFLTSQDRFSHVPRILGALEYETDDNTATLAIVQELVDNEGDAWEFTLAALDRFHNRLLAEGFSKLDHPSEMPSLMDAIDEETPESADRLIGSYLHAVEMIGVRTAEMHNALAAGTEPDFAPEAFTPLYQRSLYQSMRSQARLTLAMVRRQLEHLPKAQASDAARLLAAEKALMAKFAAVRDGKIDAQRIRGHGDYHLGQLLFTGRDFVILDFEGEPARSIGERRLKWSPLRDIAGMFRSFDYAAAAALFNLDARGIVDFGSDRFHALQEWDAVWRRWVGAAFLRSYFEFANEGSCLPQDSRSRSVLLDAYVLEKAMYEIDYELNNRPDWLSIPLRGILDILGGQT